MTLNLFYNQRAKPVTIQLADYIKGHEKSTQDHLVARFSRVNLDVNFDTVSELSLGPSSRVRLTLDHIRRIERRLGKFLDELNYSFISFR